MVNARLCEKASRLVAFLFASQGHSETGFSVSCLSMRHSDSKVFKQRNQECKTFQPSKNIENPSIEDSLVKNEKRDSKTPRAIKETRLRLNHQSVNARTILQLFSASRPRKRDSREFEIEVWRSYHKRQAAVCG